MLGIFPLRVTGTGKVFRVIPEHFFVQGDPVAGAIGTSPLALHPVDAGLDLKVQIFCPQLIYFFLKLAPWSGHCWLFSCLVLPGECAACAYGVSQAVFHPQFRWLGGDN